MAYGSQLENVKNRQLSGTRSNSYCVLDLEIDHSLESTLSSGLCDVSKKDIPLYEYKNIPDFLKGNPFLTDGYRVSLPFSLCLKRFVNLT